MSSGFLSLTHTLTPSLSLHTAVHGCLDELIALLEKCKFNPAADQVVLVGDLVNKGE
jgi:hypothetical protein